MKRLLGNLSARRDWLSLAAVLLAAAAMRLGDIGVAQYRFDEATLSGLAQDIVAGRGIPTLGLPTTTGIPWSPASVYVMTIPYLISDSPLVATAFVALLNVIGAGLLWWLARRFISPTAAFVGGLVYALNPWAILTSRKIWTPYLTNPFMILAMLVGLYGFVEGRRRAQAACLPLFVIAAQIHPEAVALLPAYAWLVWLGRRRLYWPGLALSIVLAALTLIPYSIGLAQLTPQEHAAVQDLIAGEGRGFAVNWETFPLIAQYVTGLGIENWVVLPRQFTDLWAQVPPQAALWFVMGGLTLVGLPAVWLRYRRIAVLLALWAALPFVFLTLGLTRLQTHYLIVSLPAFSLLAAIAVEWLAARVPSTRLSIVYRFALFAGLGLILATQGLWWRGLVRYLDTTATPGGFGTPLHYLMDIRAQLAHYNDVVIVGAGGRTSSWIWQPLLYHVGCVREAVMPEGGIVVFPGGPFASLYPPDAANAALDDRVRTLYQRGEATVYPLRERENPYTVYVFDSAPAWTGPALKALAPARFDNGVTLTGYRIQADRLYMGWQLPAGDPARNYQYFAHFIDTSGERIGQRDTSFWPSKYWCAGDTAVTWVDITLPETTAVVRVGMYALIKRQIIPTSLVDDSGQPTGQFVDIPLTGS